MSDEIRIIVFFSLLSTLCLAEHLWPKRQLTVPRKLRWPNNLALSAINSLLIKFLFPVAAVGVAHWSETNNLGFFNVAVTIPFWLEVLLSIVILDLLIYFQHVLFHFVPLLWRLHKVHHVDMDLDVTSGARFHSIEIILSMVIKMLAVSLIGAPALGVFLFEVILNATSMFNHSNIRIPIKLDKLLRLFIVTPDIHRVHHSIEPRETNSNFGFNLPFWDRLFGTYKAQPQLGHEHMFIGLTEYRDPQQVAPLHKMLSLPFKKVPEKINQ